jgi:hypothetical protein
MGLDMPPAANTSARGGARKNPRDLTGIRGQQLAAEAAANKAEAAAQVAEAREAERRAELATVVDYTDAPTTGTKPNDVAEVDETEVEVEEIEIEVRPRTKRIRMLDDLPDMTFGREVISDAVYDENGNMTRYPVLGGLRTYNFKAGVTYDVPPDVAGHLASLGYTYDN